MKREGKSSGRPDFANEALDILLKNHSRSLDPRPFYWGWIKDAKKIGTSKKKIFTLKALLK